MTALDLPFQHRILLIEDDNVSLFAASEMLSRLTTMIDMARDVAEAIEQLNTVSYNLVIADINLPDGTGIDIIRSAYSAAESKNKTTPFVALTAHQDKNKHQAILESGFMEVATKPLSLARAYLFLERCSSLQKDKPVPAALPVIDLELGMKRMGAKNDEKAVIAIGMLVESLEEDILELKRLQASNNIIAVREILHKIKGGLEYSGVPRLQKQVDLLYSELNTNTDLSALQPLFDAIYEQTMLLTTAYQQLVADRRPN
ncbi:MAG: putative sensory histidine-kinase / response regulator [Gammaproteobacteria bacterium]|jgi:two-component system sensor histidine kinase BarA|nr:putative sensory histidine-kinase / response regulator [Gammaproteobacteria bacterium]